MSDLEIENERLSAELERLKADVERRGELITTLEDEIERLQADGAMRIERLRVFLRGVKCENEN
jgi:uncharacterized small protein (DUF1192 family)